MKTREGTLERLSQKESHGQNNQKRPLGTLEKDPWRVERTLEKNSRDHPRKRKMRENPGEKALERESERGNCGEKKLEREL